MLKQSSCSKNSQALLITLLRVLHNQDSQGKQLLASTIRRLKSKVTSPSRLLVSDRAQATNLGSLVYRTPVTLLGRTANAC